MFCLRDPPFVSCSSFSRGLRSKVLVLQGRMQILHLRRFLKTPLSAVGKGPKARFTGNTALRPRMIK